MANIVQIIENLSSTSGRNDKIEILKSEGSDLLKSVLDRTYNPRYVYKVRNFDCRFLERNKTIEQLWKHIDVLLDSLHHGKISGDVAREACSSMWGMLTPEDASIFWNMLKGDLRCGINVGTINKAFPKFIPETPYMRCSLEKSSNIKTFDWDAGVYSQVKADGMFVNVLVDDSGSIQMLSRAGTEFPMKEMEEFAQAISNLPHGMVYMGEMVVYQNDQVLPREAGNGILNSILKGGSFGPMNTPFFYYWDVVTIDEWHSGVSNKPYNERYETLMDIPPNEYSNLIDTQVVHNMGEAKQHYMECVGEMLEGTVIKNPHGIWKDGTSKDQVKLKVEAEVDLLVIGFKEGNGKNAATFGSLLCETSDGKLSVAVSGFTDANRKRIHEEMDSWIGSKIITVRANSIMINPDGTVSLFLPRFVEERLDKTVADDFDKVVSVFSDVSIR